MCKHCKSDYAYNAHKNGTNTYQRHLQICKLVPRNGDISRMMVNAEAKLQARKIDQSVFRELVAKTIIQHDLPFSYVEYERVRETWKYLNADVKFFSRNTAAADVYKFYEIETDKLKRELAQLPGRISLTTDLWSALTHEGYMCLTTHYIDRNWKLNNKILVFCAFPPPHTGMNLAMEILGKLKDWGIEKKVFSITVDNAGNNDTMQEIVKSQLVLRDDLLCKGDFFHVRCAAHILNIIVQIGLKGIGDTLEKIRESIKYVKGSEHREILFVKCVENVGIDLKADLLLDVATRWNSTFKMLDRALKYRVAFEVSDIFAIATVFDPRLKLTLADYCFAKLDISTREKRMKHLRAQLRKLFEVYENKSNAVSPTTESREDVTHDDETAKGNFSNYDSTLDMYLDEPAMNVKGFERLDILNYWKDNGPRFGKLASMACDILSIPITTVASESSFSIGTRVLSKYRSRLLPRNVQALICNRNWLKGFESYENEEYEKFDAEDETLPSFQSLVDDADGC
ncbi:unnamed protein product [Arabidopsis thaliana]|uniref:(thale cress) hypothetical protein n=1 Tax=Arabidopsis thaliana TaxID=3702 RepID=A0A7G2ER36_ARATH|nr:unnamed protein product [Arabidopsis thaliana]